ncbi:MAG: type II toxin-antitoxin system VapC family toxin [Phycicoccus sp.]|nr:type II toxin-antitoxin system VapC family toxin [Phycicoccus sp.]
MIYLDTSALAKLVVEEPESGALARWLDDRRHEVLVTSVVTKVELVRAASRHSPGGKSAALMLMAELALVPIDPSVIDTAWSLDPPALRSLDALHLASALSLNATGLTFVAYDHRLVAAAASAGLMVEAPGIPA